MRITHHLPIAAPIAQVWALTLNVEAWPQHTPTITRVERLDDGPLRVGSTARVKQPWQAERTWTVTALDPPNRFAWATRWLGVTLTGVHDLDPIPEGTQSTLHVEIRGRLSPLVGALLWWPVRRAIAQENRGIQVAAERR